MSASTLKSLLDPDEPSVLVQIAAVNGWQVALGVMAIVLVVGGVITTSIGLGTVGDFGGTVLGQNQEFDTGVATAIVGGAAIVLGLLVATVWLAIGAVTWPRRAQQP